MTLRDLELAVARLSRADLDAFAQWFDNYFSDTWDRRIEADILAGRLDQLGQQAEADSDAGRCTPL